MTLVVVLVVLVVLLAVAVVLLLWCVRHGVRSRVTLGNALRRSKDAGLVASLAFYGDSLTAGAGASPGRDYPSLVARFFEAPSVTVAVGGATSTQIAALAESAGTPRADTALVWLGRNNYSEPDTVVADVARTVALLRSGTRFRVLGVIPSAEDEERPGTARASTIDDLNDRLRARYDGCFVDVARVLDPPGDGRTPPPVRSDHVHLNDRGYALVAATVIASLLEE